MGYKAAARLKVGHKEYIERGESVTEDEVDNWELLLESKSVVSDEAYALLFPEVQQGANQAFGTPSNLEQIEGTELQMNPPEEGDEVPDTRVPEGNPADVVPVEGAPTPGDGSDSAGQDVDPEEDPEDPEE